MPITSKNVSAGETRALRIKVGKRLAIARKAAGLSQRQLAEAVGATEGSIGHYEKGRRSLPPEVAMRIAPYLHTTPEYLLWGNDSRKVGGMPLSGVIGRAGIVSPMGQEDAEMVPIPPGGTSTDLLAYRIQTPTLGRFAPGDIIYTQSETSNLDDCFGRMCLVELEDGRTLLRTVQPGDTPGLVTLTANGASEMRNLRIATCRPVRYAAFA